MNRVVAILFAALLIASLAFAQAPAPQGTQPAQGAPSGQQPQAGQQPAQAAPATPAPLGRKLPEAKSKEEFEAYRTAITTATDAATTEAAAVDFAKKFPQSEIRSLIFTRAMMLYQQQNNAEKAIEMGREVLKIVPNDPSAATIVAYDLAETTRSTDLDKDEKLKEAEANAKLALANVDTNLLIPQTATPEQVDGLKRFVRSSAYGALAQTSLVREDYKAAEEYLRKGIDSDPANPEPVLWLRLSIALDRQKRYPEALNAANKALSLSPANSPMFNQAKDQRDRLTQLAGSGAAAPQTTPAKPATQAPAPTKP